MKKILVFSFLCFLLVNCSSDEESSPDEFSCNTEVEPKGNRLLGIDILDETPSSNFSSNFDLASSANINFIHVHMTWTSIEPAPEQYEDPNEALASFDAFTKANDIKLNLTLRPIDLTGKTVPSDLENMRFNDPIFIERFTQMLDFVFSKFNYQQLTNIQIGNEIDGYDTSNEHPDFWSDYGEFLFAVNQYIDQNYPGLDMGFTGTFYGLTEGSLSDAGVFTSLSSTVDIVGVTYYPKNDDFNVYMPDVPFADLDKLTSEFSGNTIYLQEVGYQTSSTNNSSEDKQAEFVCNMFSAWDEHKDQIPLMLWVRLHDASQEGAEELAGPYGLSSGGFLEYLRTLGLRTYEGEDKLGFEIFVDAAKKRNW